MKKLASKVRGEPKVRRMGVLTMELSPSAAKAFLAKRGINEYAETDTDNERFNAELLDLEDEAKGAFCSSKAAPTPVEQSKGKDSVTQPQQGVE